MELKPSNINLILIFCCLFFTTSCAVYLFIDPMYEKAIFDIVLRNESGVDMRVEGYYKKVRHDNITIKNNSEIVNHVEFKQSNLNNFNLTNVFSFDYNNGLRDSIAIIFAEKRVIIQTCPTGRFVSDCGYLENNLDLIAQEKNKVHKSRINQIKKASVNKFCVTITKDYYARAQAF